MESLIVTQNEVIHRRVGHIVVPYKHFVIVWGGFMSEQTNVEAYCPTDQIWFYNCITEVWSLGQSKGFLPFKNSGSTAVVNEDNLYIYGGVEELSESAWRYSCELYRLDLKTLIWHRLNPKGVPPQGCDKGVGWAYDHKIYFFGGYGLRSRQPMDGYSFDMDHGNLQGSRGWNNQLTCYDPLNDRWFSPQAKGSAPRPRAAHAADLNGSKIYIFGGRLGDGRVNDLHCLDMVTMTWTKIILKEGMPQVPEGRSWHTFNFVGPNRAILYGGLNRNGNPCKDWWECLVDKEGMKASWRLRGGMPEPLVWHKAAFSRQTNELLIIGGVTKSPYVMREKDHVDKLLVIPFAPSSLFRLCLQEIIRNGLLSSCVDDTLPNFLFDIILARTVPQVF